MSLVNLLLEETNITPFTITLEEIIGVEQKNILESIKTDSEKKILIARIYSLNESTNNKFSSWNLEQRCRYLASHKFLYFSGTKGIWIPRSPILDWKSIYFKVTNLLQENLQNQAIKEIKEKSNLNKIIKQQNLTHVENLLYKNNNEEMFKWDSKNQKMTRFYPATKPKKKSIVFQKKEINLETYIE